jgi:hypothetical protein
VTRALRYGLGALAIVICAWFVVGARQAHEQDIATDLIAMPGAELHAAVYDRTTALLDSAAFLDPGVNVTILRAAQAQEAQRYGRAERYLAEAVRAEPDNLAAWGGYVTLAVQLAVHDPRYGGSAAARTRLRRSVDTHLHELDPQQFGTG